MEADVLLRQFSHILNLMDLMYWVSHFPGVLSIKENYKYKSLI